MDYVWYNVKYEYFALGNDKGDLMEFQYDWVPDVIYRQLHNMKWWIRL